MVIGDDLSPCRLRQNDPMTLCCLILTALSAMSMDLSSTAAFTKQGVPEANPLGAWLVEGPGTRGEAISGLVLGSAYLAAEASDKWRWFVVSGVIGHTAAVMWNRHHGWEGQGMLLGPIVSVRW